MIIGCALFMELIDATAVLTALPQMAQDFGEPSVRMNLVVSLYLLAVALFVPVSGWAADRFGPRRVFISAIVLFTLASVACACAGSLLQLSLARLAQGASGAMMVPVGQVILLRWSARENLLRAMSYLTVAALVGPLLGPPLGGLLVTVLSWHWIFLINVPIGVLGVILVLRYIPDYSGAPGQPLDIPGLLLSGVALGGLVFGFEVLGHGLLPRQWALLLIGGGLLSAWLYVLHARRTTHPLIDFSLLKIPTFAVSFWGGNLMRIGSASQPFLLVLLFQLCFGLNPLQAGLLSVARGGRVSDEDAGGTDRQPLWLPAYLDQQCRTHGPDHPGVQPVRGVHAVLDCGAGAVWQRDHSLAAVQHPGRADLRRCAAGAIQPRQQPVGDDHSVDPEFIGGHRGGAAGLDHGRARACHGRAKRYRLDHGRCRVVVWVVGVGLP